MTLSEMVAKADAVTGPAADASRLADSSLHSSSKRTRTSNGTALHPSTAAGDTPSVAGSQSASMHTNLTGAMEAFGVSEGGGGSTHGRSRRSRVRPLPPPSVGHTGSLRGPREGLAAAVTSAWRPQSARAAEVDTC